MTRTITGGGILALVVFLGGALVRAEEQDRRKTAESAKNVSSANSKSFPLAPINTDYRIGVNDVLDVYVWREPELSRVIPVRPDGKISLPLVGELRAAGRSALEVSEIISERLRTYVTAPEVTVIIQQINSQRYFVLGQVQNAGAFPLTNPTTAVQALAMAGGFREWADTDKITILRQTEDNQTVRIQFSYKKWIDKQEKIEHLKLKNGDIIVVR